MGEEYRDQDGEQFLDSGTFPVTAVLLTKDFYRPVLQTDKIISISGQEMGGSRVYRAVSLPNGITIGALQSGRVCYLIDPKEAEQCYGFMLSIQGIGEIGDEFSLEGICRVTAIMIVHDQESYFLKSGRAFREDRNISSAPLCHFERALKSAKTSLRKKLKRVGITSGFPYGVGFFSSYTDEEKLGQLEIELRVEKLFREI